MNMLKKHCRIKRKKNLETGDQKEEVLQARFGVYGCDHDGNEGVFASVDWNLCGEDVDDRVVGQCD